MRYVACQQKTCDNKGAPYHVDDGNEGEYPCPMCGKPLSPIDDPTVAPAEEAKPKRKSK